jgi:hypothetical protein
MRNVRRDRSLSARNTLDRLTGHKCRLPHRNHNTYDQEKDDGHGNHQDCASRNVCSQNHSETSSPLLATAQFVWNLQAAL